MIGKSLIPTEDQYGGFDFEAHVAYWQRPEHSFHSHSRETSLYFVADGHAIKIGTSDNPADRRRFIQVCNPREVRLLGWHRCPLGVESALHDHFHASRIRGEWFKRSPALTRLIKTLVALEDERCDRELAEAREAPAEERRRAAA